MTQTDEEASLPPPTPPPTQVQEPNTSDPASGADQDNALNSTRDDSTRDENALDKLGELLFDLRIQIRNNKNKRNTLRDENRALSAEIAELKARLREIENASLRLTAQARQAEARLRTEHAAEVKRLSQDVEREKQRAANAATAQQVASHELRVVNERVSQIQATAADNTLLQSLHRTFGDRIAEALTAVPAYPQPTQYRMTSSKPARGPDRRSHPEFMPADGLGLFVVLRGKVAWLRIWLQEQY